MDRNDRAVLILGIIVIVLLLVGYYFLLLSPLRQDYLAVRQERIDKEAQLARLDQEVARLEEIRRNAPDIERQLLELNKRIPTQPEIPTLVVQIEEIAEGANVTQLSIEPAPAEPPPGGGNFQRIPLTMTFEGTYDELQDFLLRARNLARLMTINEVAYEPVDQEDVVSVERLLRVGIEAEVYFQPPAGVAAPAPVEAPAPPEGATDSGATTPDPTEEPTGGATGAG